MHVPQSTTKEAGVLSFEKALEAAMSPKDYDEKKWLYVPPFYTEYRYILAKLGEDPIICVGINPSTAEPDNLDNTLKSVERVSRNNGYDGFIMFNVYAQRATDPDDMETEKNTYLHAQNMAAFEYALTLSPKPKIWAAWGTIVERRGYLFSCLYDMISLGEKYGAEWLTAGKRSKAGHPHHPLYLKADSVFEPFDVEKYANTLI